ncbi:MAG: hypothetical protein R6V25_14705 [Desulfatiglandales bacterium]
MNIQEKLVIYRVRKALLPLLLFTFLPFLPVAGAAGSPPATPTLEETQTQVVLIQDKSTGANLVFVKERVFRVAPEATIKDKAGKPLTLENLAVPCSARMTFSFSGYNRLPFVTKIICLD